MRGRSRGTATVLRRSVGSGSFGCRRQDRVKRSCARPGARVIDEQPVTGPGANDATSSSTRSRLWRELEPIIRLISATVIIGASTGALIGGVGGRIAMRVLFLTSDDAVKGVTSDDGFEIGRFTLGDTLGLVLLTALLGVLAALLLLVARPFLAPLGSLVVPLMAAFYGVVGGAMMVHRGGVDFNILEPAALAIALFTAICAAFGAAVAWLIDAAAATDAWPQTRRWWLLGPPLVLVVIPPFVIAGFAAGAFNWLETTAARGTWRWRALEGCALAVMFGLFLLGAVDLTRDTASLT
jgi:hypothetical protein